jgi:dienelactone hydrolase
LVLTLVATTVVMAASVVPVAQAGSCTVLTLHPGSFAAGNVQATLRRTVIRAMPKVREVPVEYTLGNVTAAYRDTRSVARRQRGRVVAYGESAGGTIAGWMAARRRVDAAVTVGAPMNIPAWTDDGWTIGLAGELAWRYSPKRVYARQRPLWQYHYESDPAVPKGGQRLRGSQWRLVPGAGHYALNPDRTRAAIRAACET